MVDDGYYQDSMNSVLQTSLSAVKLYTTCRHGHYLCREEVKKGSMPYDAWCNLSPSGVQETCSVKTAGSPCRLQGCRDEDVYVADLHIGETHVRVSVMMLPALRGSDGKSHVSCHMHESVCFSRFRFRPMLRVKMDYPI